MATHTSTVGYGPSRNALIARRPGIAPGSPGWMPESLPKDALDGQVFGVLAALEADAPGFLSELIGEFTAGVVRWLQAMGDALRTGDTDGLTFAAHGMRGSCGTVGALRMARIAAEIEGLPEWRRDETRALVGHLGSEYHAVRIALRRAVPTADIA